MGLRKAIRPKLIALVDGWFMPALKLSVANTFSGTYRFLNEAS